jgi:hypothetical protein
VARNQPLGVQSLHQLVRDITDTKEPIAGFKAYTLRSSGLILFFFEIKIFISKFIIKFSIFWGQIYTKIVKISNFFFFFLPSGENLPKKESLLRSLWGRSLHPKTRDDGKAKMRDDDKVRFSSCVN